jgi:hypothetical protein
MTLSPFPAVSQHIFATPTHPLLLSNQNAFLGHLPQRSRVLPVPNTIYAPFTPITNTSQSASDVYREYGRNESAWATRVQKCDMIRLYPLPDSEGPTRNGRFVTDASLLAACQHYLRHRVTHRTLDRSNSCPSPNSFGIDDDHAQYTHGKCHVHPESHRASRRGVQKDRGKSSFSDITGGFFSFLAFSFSHYFFSSMLFLLSSPMRSTIPLI